MAALLIPTSVRADPTPSSRNLAQVLFDQAHDLVAQGKYPEACRKFDESQHLDPGGGTLLNLALCHEKEGKLAAAWGELREALDAARRDRRAEREKLASEHLAAVEPRLPFLTVQVTRVQGDPKVEVRVDGTLLTEAAWGTAIPVDPAEHAVEARAAGKKPWTGRAWVHERERATLVVPELSDAPNPLAPQQPVVVTTGTSSGRRTAAYVAGSVAFAALGVGTYFGISAIQDSNDAKAHCAGDTCTTTEDYNKNQSATTEAWVADVAFGVGIIGAGLSVYWLLTAPSADPTPVASRGAARASVPLIVAPLSDRAGAVVTWRATW